MEALFDTIRCTLAQNGCIIIADETGFNLAANVSVAVLMEFEHFELFQSVLYLKRVRPGINLSSNFLEILQFWNEKRTKVGIPLQNTRKAVYNIKIDFQLYKYFYFIN